MNNKHTFCPRCIEDWVDENGEWHKGEEKPSACDECGVCKDCEHMIDCSQAITPKDVDNLTDEELQSEIDAIYEIWGETNKVLSLGYFEELVLELERRCNK